ncbi:hypothetical protein M3M35_00700 [Fructilactobacillus myrtifloralis]|uniref:Holin-like toxin n=1 Tax=Fructilactobacillus myrtifloralis TaxID=2940301 RepID=A0ABY5BNQ2_9LACO|nr:hypothetical protein [Fructilactobacillus myrtifloralis]USS85217.1 hypothetical protein M3M35_00700 [Fructilactobacillus myrtifloralis]
MKNPTSKNTPLLVESLVVGGLGLCLQAVALTGLTYWSLTHTTDKHTSKK